jgi:hypothetical protein
MAPSRLIPKGEVEDTLEGRVVFVGELPKIKDFTDQMYRRLPKGRIVMTPEQDRLDPTWRIDPKSRGVANVVVFIRRPADGVLPIAAPDKVRKDTVMIETPYTAYVPHMAAYYPEWFDGKERGPTGQELVFRNSDTLYHNVRVTSSNKNFSGFNVNMESRGELIPTKAFKNKSQHLSSYRLPYMVADDLYTWMSAYVWCFDHPYFAITNADGRFRIPRVPAGIQVQVMAWHESEGWLFTKDGKTMTLKKGKNTLEFEIGVE